MSRCPFQAVLVALTILLGHFPGNLRADYRDIPTKPTAGDRMLAEYFELQTREIEKSSLAGIKTKEDWEKAKEGYRAQLFEMLGLHPLPARTPLNAGVTGQETHEGIVVEKVVFQSSPQLYVTGNFYRPVKQKGPLPTILYVCGHGPAKKGGVSFGNKVSYQHHGAWFARNGYTCLVIDTLQMGEIEGIHHGTYRYDRWWWHSRGYTSAGVEAWNCMRALDYLETRKEVDMNKIGVTGRSGGGAYSWWIAALDERIKVAVPVAGIASLRNHVVDGCVEGHCDCMFQVNTYRWDYPMIAALVAPRPLLIANTDKDTIFPLDGVVDVYTKTRRIYKLLGAEANIGLGIYEGPHKDTQPLRTVAFHWFERFLKGRALTDEMADTTAPKPFAMEELQVFKKLPGDERNTKIDESFTKRVPEKMEPPKTAGAWKQQRDAWISQLSDQVFRGWPREPGNLDVRKVGSVVRDRVRLSRYEFTSEKPWRLSFVLVHSADLDPADTNIVSVEVITEPEWGNTRAALSVAFPDVFKGTGDAGVDEALFRSLRKGLTREVAPIAYVMPRGVGPTAWTTAKKERTQILRRFALVGQTLDGMRVWDIRRAIQAIRTLANRDGEPMGISLGSSGAMAGNALYASLFEPEVSGLDLSGLPASHHAGGPHYLNVLRVLDMPQALAIATERSEVLLFDADADQWTYPRQVGKLLEWKSDRLQIFPTHTR